jgi:hypothetical protein
MGGIDRLDQPNGEALADTGVGGDPTRIVRQGEWRTRRLGGGGAADNRENERSA